MSTPPKIPENTIVKHYQVNKELGAGCFGRVYECADTKNNM